MPEQYSQVIEFMRNRRSVPAKTMSGPGPEDSEIAQMIEIASRVPDHGKIAPWRFRRYHPAYCEVLGEKFVARALELNPEMSEDLIEIERTRFTRVPVVIGIFSAPVIDHPKVPVWEQQLSAGAAAMNLLIAANAFGWDAQWLTEWIAFDETLASALGVKPGEKIAGFVYIGTRTMPKTERDRPAIEEIYSIFEG